MLCTRARVTSNAKFERFCLFYFNRIEKNFRPSKKQNVKVCSSLGLITNKTRREGGQYVNIYPQKSDPIQQRKPRAAYKWLFVESNAAQFLCAGLQCDWFDIGATFKLQQNFIKLFSARCCDVIDIGGGSPRRGQVRSPWMPTQPIDFYDSVPCRNFMDIKLAFWPATKVSTY
jgi:hypothetical protein